MTALRLDRERQSVALGNDQVRLSAPAFRMVAALIAAAGKPVSYADLGRAIRKHPRVDERSVRAFLRIGGGTVQSLRGTGNPIWPVPGFGYEWREPH